MTTWNDSRISARDDRAAYSATVRLSSDFKKPLMTR